VRQGLRASDDPLTCAGTYHPAICRHGETGCEVLFLGRRRNAYVEDLSLQQSEQLLDELWQQATAPHLSYSHQWQVGDVLMWDNRSTLHRRDPFDQNARRYILRTQIKGSKPPCA
jgi:alpha-ketoglutarate-dependent taurine dioxygenase